MSAASTGVSPSSSAVHRSSDGRILQLSQDVINRIAAGEVVQRPSAALKELMENSIDAGATKIQVYCQDGGLGVLQITDDGCGIHKEDLPLLCERFATSKIRHFDDLFGVTSFGFRGEALASISHVAQVSVITMRRKLSTDASSSYAFAARFVDGKLVSGPDITAGNPGTTIKVENLFYNTPVRKASLGKPTEEYARILDLVHKYSFCFPEVAFSCRHVVSGSSGTSMNQATGSAKQDYTSAINSTLLNNLRHVYGMSIAKHLVALEETIPLNVSTSKDRDVAVRISGFLSDVTLTSKRQYFVLFVNQRLVDSAPIKRCLDQVYASVLTGGNKYAAFLRLDVPPSRVDVNIHPTKHEVMLMDEDVVLRGLTEGAKRVIAASSAAKQLHVGQLADQNEAMNLKPVSASSTNVSTFGHRGVVVAPCTVTRVEQQRGDMLKFVVPVDRFALVAEDQKQRNGLSSSTAPPEPMNGADGGRGSSERRHPPPAASSGRATVMVLDDDECPTEVNEGRASEAAVVDPSSTGAGAAALSTWLFDNEDEDDDVIDDPLAEFRSNRAAAEAPPAMLQGAQTSSSSRPPQEAVQLLKEETIGSSPPLSSPTQESPQESSQAVDSATASAPTTLQLTSVKTVIAALEAQSADDVSSMFRSMVFVGILHRDAFFAQSGTSLFCVKTSALAEDIAYQRLFTHFGNHIQVTFVDGTAPDVMALLHFAWCHDLSEVDRRRNVDNRGAVAVGASQHTELSVLNSKWKVLRRWRHMLSEYFGIEIVRRPAGEMDAKRHRDDDENQVEGCNVPPPKGAWVVQKMPLLLGDSWPLCHRALPRLLWRLADEVSYELEEPCLLHIAKILSSELFGPHTVHQTSLSGSSRDATDRALYDAVRFGLVPACSGNSVGQTFFPSMELFTKHVVRTVVTVEALYKVFERC